MNRHQRRKLSRYATAAEIFPAGEKHGPIQQTIRDRMIGAMDSLLKMFPDHTPTLFLAEKGVPDGADRLPRFNYISAAERADMLAVLKAWIAKQEELGPTLDKIGDAPPTGTVQ